MLPIEEAIASIMKSHGFKKKARTWWRTAEDSIQVVNLQKSQYGERIYFNLGLYIRSLGSETTPPANKCHIQVRLERVVPESLYVPVASASSEMKPNEELLKAMLYGIQWLESLGNPESRKARLGEASSSHWFVFGEAREA